MAEIGIAGPPETSGSTFCMRPSSHYSGEIRVRRCLSAGLLELQTTASVASWPLAECSPLPNFRVWIFAEKVNLQLQLALSVMVTTEVFLKFKQINAATREKRKGEQRKTSEGKEKQRGFALHSSVWIGEKGVRRDSRERKTGPLESCSKMSSQLTPCLRAKYLTANRLHWICFLDQILFRLSPCKYTHCTCTHLSYFVLPIALLWSTHTIQSITTLTAYTSIYTCTIYHFKLTRAVRPQGSEEKDSGKRYYHNEPSLSLSLNTQLTEHTKHRGNNNNNFSPGSFSTL